MYNWRSRHSIVWSRSSIQVAAGATVDVVPGDQATGLSGTGGANVVSIMDLDHFSFAMNSDVNLNLIIQLSPLPAPAGMITWITHAYLTAAGWHTVYDMAAPYGGAGSQGVLGLGGGFMRLQINNATAGATTRLYFTARAWHV